MKTKKKSLDASSSEEQRGRSEPGIRHHFPPKKDVSNESDKRDRCELCMFWHMRDPKQKGQSCYERGFYDHDLCGAFTAKPPRVRHDLIREIQTYSMPEILFSYDVLEERSICIRQQTKKLIRSVIKKQDGAVVYYRVPGEKKKHGEVERVTSSMVWLKNAKDDKVRVDYVIEVISLDEYKSRKSNKVNKREDLGRKVKET